jgi:putative two-component system response regulator
MAIRKNPLAAAGRKGGEAPAPVTILVVEDNPVNMELVSDVLESAGHAVVGAGSAEEGIALARRRLPDLILMDIALPGMDGLSATAALKRDPLTRDIPVVALTAHAMKGDAEKAIGLGCAGYITKPIEVKSFLATLRRCLDDPQGAASAALAAISAAPRAGVASPAEPAAAPRPAVAAVPAPAATAPAVPSPAPAAPRVSRLLIAAGEPQQRQTLEDLARGLGYDALTAADGAAALALLAQGGIDLAAVCAPFPDTPDADLIRRMRQAAPDLPVLTVVPAGMEAAADALRAVEAGATDRITRPVDQMEWRTRVAALLQVGEARAAARAAKEEARLARLEVTEAEQRAKRAQIDTLQRLAYAAECRSPDLLGELHLHCVGQYAAVLAQAAGMPPAQIEALTYASTAHDVGLMFVPERLLRKKRPTRADRQAVAEHTTLGANFLAGASGDLVRTAEQIARAHHERWGGGGYPHGLSGEEIPLPARICAVADAFDTFARQNPEADIDAALEAVAESHGTVLDPTLVDLFLNKRDRLRLVFDRARQQRLDKAREIAEREAADAERRESRRRAAAEAETDAAPLPAPRPRLVYANGSEPVAAAA